MEGLLKRELGVREVRVDCKLGYFVFCDRYKD